MNARTFARIALIAAVGLFAGCNSEDIPQAHKGQMFDRTGALAFYSGGVGLTGPVLGPGTHFTGLYDELRVVDCSSKTIKETMESLTKDNVQFKVDVYIRFKADCADESVKKLLGGLSPDVEDKTISNNLLFTTYVRPAIGEALRFTISPHAANDINNKREEILGNTRRRFLYDLAGKDDSGKKVADADPVTIEEVTLSNLDFPEEMDHANTQRAVQSVLKDKAIAERERVTAEIETAKGKTILAQAEGEIEAVKIDKIGAALRRNPEYLQFDMQSKMTEIYREAGLKGNMIVAAPSPTILMQQKTPAK